MPDVECDTFARNDVAIFGKSLKILRFAEFALLLFVFRVSRRLNTLLSERNCSSAVAPSVTLSSCLCSYLPVTLQSFPRLSLIPTLIFFLVSPEEFDIGLVIVRPVACWTVTCDGILLIPALTEYSLLEERWTLASPLTRYFPQLSVVPATRLAKMVLVTFRLVFISITMRLVRFPFSESSLVDAS